MNNHSLQHWAPQLAILILTLTMLACGVSISPEEIQVFTAGSASTAFPTPTPQLIPTATLPPVTATPNATADVLEAAAADNPAPTPEQPAVPQVPPDNFQSVSIASVVDEQTVEVLIDGVPYRLPYASLPPPPAPPPAPPVQSSSIDLQWDPRLSDLGVILTRARPDLGQTVYRLVKANFLNEQEADGLHHIYVEVLDESGQRLLGQPVTQRWQDNQVTGYTEDKPPPEFALNFPIYGVQGPDNYEIFVEGAPSDLVSGLGLPGGRLTAYQLTFQRQQN